MSPKDKAEELVNKFRIMIKYDSLYDLKWRNPFEEIEAHKRANKDAKMYAQVVADNVIEQEKYWVIRLGIGNSNYWKEVKEEIKKL